MNVKSLTEEVELAASVSEPAPIPGPIFLRSRRLIEVSVRLLWFAAQLLVNYVFLRRGPAELGLLARSHLMGLGGGFTRLAQALALRYDAFPPEFCEELGKTRDVSLPPSRGLASKTIEQELGQSTAELFSRLEETPFSAGSFEERYYGVLQTGDPVIIKVQRPGSRRLAEADLLAINFALRVIDFSGILGRVRLSRDYEAFRARMLQGLSYLTEARYAERLADQLSENPRKYVPKVYWSHTTEAVITLERVDGVLLSDIMNVIASSQDPLAIIRQYEAKGLNLNEAASNLANTLLSELFDGKYYGNHDPADLVIMEDNALSYVDLGSLDRIDPKFARYRFDLLWAARAGDIDSLYEVLLEYFEPPFDANLAALEETFKSRASQWLDDWNDELCSAHDRSPVKLIAVCLDGFRRLRIPVPASAMIYSNAFATVDKVVLTIAPALDLKVVWTAFFRETLAERIRRQIRFDNLSGVFLEYEALLLNFPRQFRESMRLLRRDHYAGVRTVRQRELEGWKLMHSLTTLLILAALIARAWLYFYPAPGPPTLAVLLSPTAFVASLVGLIVLRRIFKIRYQAAARGEYRVRIP